MYSVVIPVYNSAGIVAETIDRTVAYFKQREWLYELILVNDGSKDDSWEVLAEKARANPNIIAVDLARNYGQHTAISCGIQFARGEYIINMDDDLQNPPEELGELIEKAQAGHDVVFAKFISKKHGLIRRAGSQGVALLDRVLFRRPKDLAVTNFRIFRRDVADKIRAHKAPHPYLRGLLLMHATNPANAPVRHVERVMGKSNYTPWKIATILWRIFLNYAVAFPRSLVAGGIFLVLPGTVILTTAYRLLRVGHLTVGAFWLMVGTGIICLVAGIVILIMAAIGVMISRSNALGASRTGYSIRDIVRSTPPTL